MGQRRRTTVRDLRRDNRSRLLWSLYFNQPRSRQELSRATGLSPASVSNVVRGLISEGIVIEAGSVDSDGGRPSVLLRMNPEYGYVVGVDVGETRIRAGLFDLTMTEHAQAEYPLDPRVHEVRTVTDKILAGVSAVIADGGVGERAILGVGVGVPGIVGEGPDALVHAQVYGWEGIPLEGLLRAGTNLPLVVANGAETMGQAEMWFGAGRGAQRAAVALIGSGVGVSLISSEPVRRDATASAGEWGHTPVQVGGRTCRCGSRGCLEAYIGAEAILDRYGEQLPGTDEESRLAALLAEASPRARSVLDETVTYLGAGLATLINLYGPERIILGGWAGLLLGERMLPGIRAAAGEHALRQLFAATTIELGQLGIRAVELGAATLPVRRFLDGMTELAGQDRGVG